MNPDLKELRNLPPERRLDWLARMAQAMEMRFTGMKRIMRFTLDGIVVEVEQALNGRGRLEFRGL